MVRYITPAVTPLNADGTIDEKGAEALYEHLIQGGVDGILILGSIGEFFAFSVEQKKRLISLAVEKVARRVPVIVGTADTVAGNVVSLSEYALREGADAVIVVPPYYFALGGFSVDALAGLAVSVLILVPAVKNLISAAAGLVNYVPAAKREALNAALAAERTLARSARETRLFRSS